MWIIRHTSTARRSTARPAGDYPDNAERFALFSRAVLEASKILGVPHVFHCHDWQSALVPVMLRTLYAEDPAFREVATVFTIHNMGYQGLFPPDTLPLLMLPWDLLTISKMEFFGQVNFLKGALVHCRLRHHGQQEIQSGDPDHRIRIWSGRRAAQPRRDRDRHPERRGLRRVEPADRQIHRRQIFAAGSERQAEMQAGFAARLRNRERRRQKCR